MKWKNILLASVLTTSLSSLANFNVQAATMGSKDITPPQIPSFTVNKYINLSNENNFEIKGKGERNSTVLLTIKDAKSTLTYKSKTDAKGNFKVKAKTAKLAEGNVIFSIQNVDKAGNKSKVKTVNLIKDVTLEEMSIDNDGFINTLIQNEYPVSGTADLGSKIDVTIQSGKKIVTGKAVADELGNYSVDLDTTSLLDGTLKITVKQTDKAGNSEAQSVNIIKDTKAPSSPILFQAATLQSQSVNSYIVSGLGVKNGEVEVTLSDGSNEVSSIGTVDENGLFQIELDASSLLDGEITISAKQSNEAGNESANTEIKTNKDTTGPVKPVLDSLAVVSAANQAEYSISGQGENGSTIQILLTDGTTTISISGLVDETGKFNLKANLTTLKAGNIVVIASLTDTVKNVGSTATAVITKQ